MHSSSFKMWRRWLLIHIFIQVSTSTSQYPSIESSRRGKSLILHNKTLIDIPDSSQFDFQIDEVTHTSPYSRSTPRNRTTSGRQTSSQQVTCPTIFNDAVLAYFTAELSDISSFQLFELPPFLQTRFSGGPGNVALKEYIKATFINLGWTVEEDQSIQNTPLGPIQFTSVIATFNPQYTKRLVLACHFDSKFTPTGFVGAIDAAVPCTLLVDVAKKLNEVFNFVDSPVSIQMVFFDGEEPYVNFSPTDSLYGSKHLAAQWATTVDPLDSAQTKLGNIDALILLDVIGHAGTSFERYYTETDDLYSQFLSLEVCLALKGLGTRPLPLTSTMFSNTRRSFEIYDDQVPFRTYGFTKTMHMVTYPFPPEWHTLEDNLSLLDFQVIEDLNRILRVFLANYYLTDALLTIYAP